MCRTVRGSGNGNARRNNRTPNPLDITAEFPAPVFPSPFRLVLCQRGAAGEDEGRNQSRVSRSFERRRERWEVREQLRSGPSSNARRRVARAAENRVATAVGVTRVALAVSQKCRDNGLELSAQKSGRYPGRLMPSSWSEVGWRGWKRRGVCRAAATRCCRK